MKSLDVYSNLLVFNWNLMTPYHPPYHRGGGRQEAMLLRLLLLLLAAAGPAAGPGRIPAPMLQVACPPPQWYTTITIGGGHPTCDHIYIYIYIYRTPFWKLFCKLLWKLFGEMFWKLFWENLPKTLWNSLRKYLSKPVCLFEHFCKNFLHTFLQTFEIICLLGNIFNFAGGNSSNLARITERQGASRCEICRRIQRGLKKGSNPQEPI